MHFGEYELFPSLIGLGISHPCTTFDKWKLIPLVNDQYDVVDLIFPPLPAVVKAVGFEFSKTTFPLLAITTNTLSFKTILVCELTINGKKEIIIPSNIEDTNLRRVAI